MNIYRPYKVLEDSSQKLHLKQTKFQRVLLFISYRVFPLISASVVFYIIISTIDIVSLKWGYLYFGAALMILGLVFIQELIYEVEITLNNIKVTYGTFHGKVTTLYSIEEIQHITRALGKNGIFIYLVLKNKKKKLLLTFSIHKRRHKLQTIFNRLTEITGLEMGI